MRAGVIMGVLALVLTSCSSGGDGETTRERPSGDARVFPGGQKLSHYRGSPTYEWRVNVVDQQGELLAAMRQVSPGLNKGDFSDVLNTCDAIHRGIKGDALVQQSVIRFSGADQVSAAQARRLVEVSRQYACPA